MYLPGSSNYNTCLNVLGCSTILSGWQQKCLASHVLEEGRSARTRLTDLHLGKRKLAFSLCYRGIFPAPVEVQRGRSCPDEGAQQMGGEMEPSSRVCLINWQKTQTITHAASGLSDGSRCVCMAVHIRAD